MKNISVLKGAQNAQEYTLIIIITTIKDKIKRYKDFSEERKTSRKFGKLKDNYGISKEEFESLILKYNNLCAICNNPETRVDHRTGKTKSLAVDHCHKTGKIRGLLCWRCNFFIGMAKDNPERLRAAANYLENT